MSNKEVNINENAISSFANEEINNLENRAKT